MNVSFLRGGESQQGSEQDQPEGEMQRDRRPLSWSDPDDRDRQRGGCDQSPPCREPPRVVDMPRGELAAFGLFDILTD